MPEKAIKTAMLIDDGQADQILHKIVLERSGEVDTIIPFYYADDALEYLRQSQREAIDVIFLDINMPRMNGFEFLEAASAELGDDFAKAVVVMLTTSIDPKDHERADQFAVVKRFINKPLTVEHIQELVQYLQGRSPF